MRTQDELEHEELLKFLKSNQMTKILNKIMDSEFTSKDLINFSDEKIQELIEDDKKDLFPLLRDLIMKLNDQSDAINVLYIASQGMNHS